MVLRDCNVFAKQSSALCHACIISFVQDGASASSMLKSVTISMFRDRLVTFLKVRPEEIGMVSLTALLFLCVQAGQGIGENAAFALFLSTINVDYLPYMYMGLGGVVFLASIVYSASLTRFQNSRVVIFLLAGAFVMFAIEWLLNIHFDSALSFPVLWLTTYGMSVVLGTLLWNVAGEICDARQAKRLFPLFASMGILGSVVGNSLTGLIAKVAGTDSLIVLYAVLLAVGFALTRQIVRGHFKPKPVVNTRFDLAKDVRAGYDFVRGSQLFRLIAVTSILYSILFFTVDFPFSERLSSAYLNDAAGLAGFKGTFTGITTAVTFLVSLFLANRLYTRLGIINSILIMPVTYLLAFVAFFVSFNIWGAVGARFGQLVILGGVAGTAWNAMFNVVPSERRGQVLAFNNGVPTQVGVVLSGVLILLSKQVLSTQNILLLGALAAVVTVYLTLKMRSAYGDALLDALRAGRVEVFSAEEDSFAGYRNAPAAVQVILKALNDPKAFTRRLAVEMLGRMGVILAIPDLLDRLHDADVEVRAAAIKALTLLQAKPASGRIIQGLNDRDDPVRIQTLASLPKLGVDPSPDLIRTLEGLLKDPNPKICSHAAVALIHLGEGKTAQQLLLNLLRDEDAQQRLIALDAFGHILESAHGQVPFDIDFIRDALNDPSAPVRREAIRVLSLFPEWANKEPILKCLADEDVRVRRIASETLKQAWPQSRPGIIRVLEEMNEDALDTALDATLPGDPEVFDTLRAYVRHEVAKLRYLQTLVGSLPGKGRVTALLVETLKHRDSLSEERLIKAVGLFGNPRALELVRKSLNAGEAGTRAAALEALETLGDPTITKDVLPILDRGGVFTTDDEQKMSVPVVLDDLLSSKDYWLRAIAAKALPEYGLDEFLPRLRDMKSDPVPLVRQAAEDALTRLEGDGKMKTLKTLSTLDRILLLREIPMFSRLSPEDLERIADVATEQLFTSGSVICREGEPGNSLYIIVHGSVQVVKGSEQHERVIAVREGGQFVGEMAILEASMRSATLRAATEVRVLVLDGEAFKSILRDRPEVAISVLQHMSSRLRELNDRVGAAS
ncbi:MAG: MFS transporter [Anaerolineae bacterium]|nr:MFS transporter [Anaerolineae bacterium]